MFQNRYASEKKFVCIGDIHGHPEQLDDILEQLDGRPEYLRVFLGDYIDRGPDSNGVIERLRNTEGIFLMGNHEDTLFRLMDLQDTFGERDELLVSRGFTHENYEWMRQNLKSIHLEENYIFVHAGLNPDMPLEDMSEIDFLWRVHEDEYSLFPEHIVVHGHFSVPEVCIRGNNVNVDTGCGKGGRLSAILLPECEILRSASPAPLSFTR